MKCGMTIIGNNGSGQLNRIDPNNINNCGTQNFTQHIYNTTAPNNKIVELTKSLSAIFVAIFSTQALPVYVSKCWLSLLLVALAIFITATIYSWKK